MTADLSSEQLAIVYTVNTHNVRVDAVAGCGKTTTALGICKQYPDKQVLVVTYNAKLRLETRARSEKRGVNNVHVHTYHSLCHKYYTPCMTDAGMITACNQSMKPSCPVPTFDIVILDEQQDLDFVCFRFIVKFLRDNTTNPKLVVLGDVNQSIYGFKGSDFRFLTCAAECFASVSLHPWMNLAINETFRVNKPATDFINAQILHMNKLVSNKPGDKPKYILYNAFNPRIVVTKITEYLERKQYKPEDIFVLCFSIRSENKRAPIKLIENLLVEKSYPCYVPLSDDAELSEEAMAGKVTFSSFHQAKGRERKVVIVCGFDGKLINWLVDERGSNRESIINAHYVACTRASEQLFLLHHRDNPLFPTLELETLKQTCDFINGSGNKPADVLAELEDKVITSKQFNTTKSVTDLFRFMSHDDTKKLKAFFTVVETPLGGAINPRGVTTTTEQTEQVSDLYGTSITIYNERSFTKTSGTMRTLLKGMIGQQTPTDEINAVVSSLQQLIDAAEYTSNDIANLVKMCNYYHAVRSGYISRWRQTNNYDWVDTEAIIGASKIIDNAISIVESALLHDTFKATLAETSLMRTQTYITQTGIKEPVAGSVRLYEPFLTSGKLYMPTVINGYADIITPNCIYEIKCTSETQPEHLFQLATYACIDLLNKDKKAVKQQLTNTRLVLINVRTGVMSEIVNFTNKQEFMQLVIKLNSRPEITTSYEDFMQRVQSNVTQLTVAPELVKPEPTVSHVGNADLLEKLKKLQDKNKK